jgi:hypothetical protein
MRLLATIDDPLVNRADPGPPRAAHGPRARGPGAPAADAVIGNRGSIEINPRLAMNKNAAILGVALFHASSAQLVGIHSALEEGWATARERPPRQNRAGAVGRAPRVPLIV